MRFAKFNRSSGEITAILSMTEEMARNQCSSDEDIIQSDTADDRRDYVDVADGKVKQIVVKRPDARAVWSHGEHRWISSDEMRAKVRSAAIQHMYYVERRQSRAIREALLLLLPPNAEPRHHLQRIEDEIAQLRATIDDETDITSRDQPLE